MCRVEPILGSWVQVPCRKPARPLHPQAPWSFVGSTRCTAYRDLSGRLPTHPHCACAWDRTTERLGCLAVQGVLDNVNMNLPTVNINPTTQEVYAIVHATDARKALFTSGRGDTLELEMPLIDYPNSISELGESELFVKFSPELVPLWECRCTTNSWLSGGGDIAFAADGSVYLAFGHSHYLDSLRIHSSDGSFVTIRPSVGSAQYPLMLHQIQPIWPAPLARISTRPNREVCAEGCREQQPGNLPMKAEFGG